MDRVVALVDMDCFYVQVEQKLQPQFKGKPCAVAQYKTWRGGGLIAVGYEARAAGVTRHMMGDDAKKKCPHLHLFRVPELRGKADLTKYRDAGAEVITVLSKFSQCVERASVDEAYIDLSDEVNHLIQQAARVKVTDLANTYIVGHDGDGDQEKDMDSWLSLLYDNPELHEAERRLAIGAKIAEDIRVAVYTETGYRCSAGIGHNKMLAKLVCGFHKPNKQTVIPHHAVSALFQTLPLTNIRNLGGKLGQSVMEQLQVENVGDLCRFTEKELQQACGDKTGYWLYELCRGIEGEPVSARQLAKSIGCSKNFRGKDTLDTREKVKFWLSELAVDITERLEKDRETNSRVGRSLTVSVRYLGNADSVVASRACALTKYDKKKIHDDTFALIQKFNTSPPHQADWTPAIIYLGLSAGKFQEESSGGHGSIMAFLGNKNSNSSRASASLNVSCVEPSQSQISLEKNRNIVSFFKSKTSATESDGLVNEERLISDAGDSNASTVCSASRRTTNNIETEGKDVMVTKHCDLASEQQTCSGGIQQFFAKGGRSSSEDFVGMQGEQKSEKDFLSSVKDSFSNPSKNVGNFNMKKGFFASRKTPGRTCGGVQTLASSMSGNLTSVCNSALIMTEDGSSELEPPDGLIVDQDVLQSLPEDIRQEILQQRHLSISNVSTHDVQPSVSTKSESESHGPLTTNCDDDYQRCDTCGRSILVWDLPEHMDFHFAQDLQKTMTYTTPTVTKRKHDSTSPAKNKKFKSKQASSSKTIESFFGKR